MNKDNTTPTVNSILRQIEKLEIPFSAKLEIAGLLNVQRSISIDEAANRYALSNKWTDGNPAEWIQRIFKAGAAFEMERGVVSQEEFDLMKGHLELDAEMSELEAKNLRDELAALNPNEEEVNAYIEQRIREQIQHDNPMHYEDGYTDAIDIETRKTIEWIFSRLNVS